MSRMKILFVDDEPDLLKGLEISLRKYRHEWDMLFVGGAAKAWPNALEGVDIVVTDLRMPGMDGMDLLRQLKAKASALPVIIMTGHGDIPLAVEAMKLGAFDFVEKPFEDERLIGAINTALQQGGDKTKGDALTRDIAARVASLSLRERQVLDGLLAGLSNKQIARDHGISPRTIEVYRANVMTKMQARSLSELIRLAVKANIQAD